MGLGALVAVLFVAADSGAPVIGNAAEQLDLWGATPPAVLFAANGLGSILVFTVIYRYAPRSRLHWRSALIGAVPAGFAIQAIPAIVGLYFGAAAGFAAVQVFLLLAVLLGGLYVMALVLLVGAGLAVGQERRARRQTALHAPVPGARRAAATSH